MNRRPYSLVSLAKVNIESLGIGRDGQRRVVGIDVAKHRPVACLMWPDESFERPWEIAAPRQIPLLLQKLKELSAGGEVILAMESSGTYGDALRQAAQDAGIEVHRVSAKAVKDSAESFDGVASQHDGKESAVIADLCRRGRSAAWEASDEDGAELRYWLWRWEAGAAQDQMWSGRLEAFLARHWPEATEVMEAGSATLLGALARWGEPRALACDPGAAEVLRRLGGPLLEQKKIEALIESAGSSLGVRMNPWEVKQMQEVAGHRLELAKEMRLCRRAMDRLAQQAPQIQAQRQAVGLLAACVLWAFLNPVSKYPCAAAYRKAMGLNLSECSSGKYQGPLHISRRGRSLIRKVLYFAALRSIQEHEGVRAWVERKKARDGGGGGKAVVAVMRKLALATWHVGQGEAFDGRKLFGGKPKRPGSALKSPAAEPGVGA